jgi:hypothetical protein
MLLTTSPSPHKSLKSLQTNPGIRADYLTNNHVSAFHKCRALLELGESSGQKLSDVLCISLALGMAGCCRIEEAKHWMDVASSWIEKLQPDINTRTDMSSRNPAIAL